MLYDNRTDVSEGINVNKTSASEECIIYQYWYFLDKKFRLRSSVCSRCHDILMMSIDIRFIVI